MQCALINGYPKYQICENGHVYNVKTKKQIKPLVNPSTGYCTVGLRENGERVGHYNHHLVATYFLEPASAENMQVDHQDNDKQNNSKENLQWLSRYDNIRKTKDKMTTTSKYYCVCYCKRDGKWIASISTNGKRSSKYIGRYFTELEALAAHNAEAVKYGIKPQSIQN